jgi:DNA-binding Xre family transcriptional regulator
MKWNLRLAAANRGIWKASELQRLLAERGLVISAGKLSGLWSGTPNAVKLEELDVICAVLSSSSEVLRVTRSGDQDGLGGLRARLRGTRLGCGDEELLLPEPEKVTKPTPAVEAPTAATGEARRAVTPRPRTGRSLPPR